MSTLSTQDQEIRQLMAEVRDELAVVLKSEHQRLAKAQPGEETSAETPPDDSATSDSPAPETSEAPPADAPPEASASVEADAADAPADEASEPSDPIEDGMDPEAIKAELAQLPIEHVKLLFEAAKEVLMAGIGGEGDAEEDAAPTPPEASAPAPEASAPPALKNEMAAANGGEMAPVSKSQKDIEIEELKKRVSDFEALASGLLTVVETAVKVPARKAITSVTELSKSGIDLSQISKSEVKARLDRAARTNLAKSDRDLINQYAVGAISVEGIKHLLEIK